MDVTVSDSHPLGRSRSDFEVFYADRSDEVYRVAYNWALDRLRHGETPIGDFADRSVDDPLPRPDLARALDSLPVEHRAVVVLRVVHDWSEEDVAYALDIPVGTVKS